MAQKADSESFQEVNVVGELSEAISLWMLFLRATPSFQMAALIC